MTTVRDLREALERLARNDRSSAPEVMGHVKEFLKQISAHDDMDIGAFFEMFRTKRRSAGGRSSPGSTRPKPAKINAADAAKKLRAAFESDNAFDAELEKLNRTEGATIALLRAVYVNLFGSSAGLPTRVRRDELLRHIGDKRLVAVRDAKAIKAMRRRAVPAD